MKKNKLCTTQPVPDLSKVVSDLLLTHDRTIAEEHFLVILLLFLKDLGYFGEVHVRCFLANSRGQYRRPDLYLPRLGLVIEIDGKTRDAWQHRQNDTKPRDEFYESIGVHPPLVLDAHWVVSPCKIEQLKYQLKNYIFGKKLRPNPKKLKATAKMISVGRRLVAVKRPGLFDSSGSLAPVFIQDLDERGFKEYRHFGGTRYILRAKYKERFNPENMSLDFSNTEKYIQDLHRANDRKFARADVGLPD